MRRKQALNGGQRNGDENSKKILMKKRGIFSPLWLSF